jgi:hypothetical protein
MTARYEAKLSMYNAVLTHAEANPTITSTVPAFATQVTTLRSIYNDLVAAAQSEVQNITGVTMDKAQVRKAATDLALQVSAAVYSFAAATSNNTLKEQMNFPPSSFARLRDEMVVPICNNIHNAATAHQASLVPYGVSNGLLSDLADATEEYAAVIATPRNAVTQRTSYSETMKNLFKDADALLKLQMDKVALQFKAANPEFYTAYKQNRIILDAATSATQVTGTVTDSETGQPVANVTVQVVDEPYTTTTNATGEYVLKVPVPGTYTIAFTVLAGYNNKTQTAVVVTLGQTTTLNTTLVPLPV